MAYNSATTFGEITSLTSEIFAENDILVLRKRDLARIFLRRLLELDETADDAKLENAYRIASSRVDVPNDQGLFWEFIEKEYLGLEQEPQDKFLDACIQANRDLISIAKNITYINNQKETLSKKITAGGRLSPEERYYRNQLAYYEDKNLLARNEIVEFLTHKIKQYAISKASFSKFNLVSHCLPFFVRLSIFLPLTRLLGTWGRIRSALSRWVFKQIYGSSRHYLQENNQRMQGVS